MKTVVAQTEYFTYKQKPSKRERLCKEVGSTDMQTNKNSQRFLYPCEFFMSIRLCNY